MLSMASNAHLNLTACRQAARSSLTDGAALADCVFPASFSDRRSDEATVGRWLKLGKKTLDFHALPTSARIEQPFVEQWHLVTQNILFRHLRELWADDHPRVMVDIGCQAVCRVHMCALACPRAHIGDEEYEQRCDEEEENDGPERQRARTQRTDRALLPTTAAN